MLLEQINNSKIQHPLQLINLRKKTNKKHHRKKRRRKYRGLNQ
jgi:hypothetical protein